VEKDLFIMHKINNLREIQHLLTSYRSVCDEHAFRVTLPVPVSHAFIPDEESACKDDFKCICSVSIPIAGF